ncbi:MAG: hypothetical protein IPG32_07980 [Saprospirales bacterium]|nr:hypothetical protein [Saprospirales bacterium]
MKAGAVRDKIIANYWEILSNLDADIRIELISKLVYSLRDEITLKEIIVNKGKTSSLERPKKGHLGKIFMAHGKAKRKPRKLLKKFGMQDCSTVKERHSDELFAGHRHLRFLFARQTQFA